MDRTARSLRCRFADRSRLWISSAGARLASNARVGSDAHRLAAALADRRDWQLLTDRPNWPVPRPVACGDWLAVAGEGRERLLRHLLRRADTTYLSGSHSVRESFRALAAEEDEAPYWEIPGAPGTHPRLLLTSPETFGRGPDALRKRMQELKHLASIEPPRLVVVLGGEHAPFRLADAAALAATIERRLAEAATPAPQTPPEEQEAPPDSRELDDDDTDTPEMGF